MDNWVCNNSTVGNRSMSNNTDSRAILRNSFICHILDNSVSVIRVVDSLNSSIGESNRVGARCCVSVPVLFLFEVVTAVVIIDSIVVCIEGRLCKITIIFCRVGNSNRIPLGGSGSDCSKCGDDDSLK